MTSLIFLDTETTGLSLDDDIWEIAAIRRDPDGTQTKLHLFVDHDPEKCSRLPESFRMDHKRRWPTKAIWIARRDDAAATVAAYIPPGAHIVGAVPNFDSERLALLLRNHGHKPPWHHHLIDVEALAVGYLHGRISMSKAGVTPPSLPWNSDDLSRACGVEPPTDGRHQAMGDAEWTMRWYDAITGGQS